MCSRRFGCTVCNKAPCSHSEDKLCVTHLWPVLKCTSCGRFVNELIHKLIFYYFHRRMDHLQGKEVNRNEVINNDLTMIGQQSTMYDIVSENWLAMEKVFQATPFMSRYRNAEEWRSALNVLCIYFDSNEEKLKLVNLKEFMNDTSQLLENFLKEKYDELLYLFVPQEKKLICIECEEKNISNRITEMIEKKPEIQAVRFRHNYANGPQWLIDDLFGHILSFLVFPKDFPSISLTCKRFYYFLHYSTNFSWLTNLTIPDKGNMEIQPSSSFYPGGVVQNIFNTYRGFRNISSITKLYNYFKKNTDRVTTMLFIHHLMKNQKSEFECNLDAISINNFEDYGLGFISYYWLIKRARKTPLKYLAIETEAFMKSFGMIMLLLNASQILVKDTIDIRLYCTVNYIDMKSVSVKSLDLTENGLNSNSKNFILASLPGSFNHYLEFISYFNVFYVDDESENVIPLLRNDLIIDTVWIPGYHSNMISTLKMMKDKGIAMKLIILDARCHNSCSKEELTELITLKTTVEVGKVNSRFPPTERWNLKSVIQ